MAKKKTSEMSSDEGTLSFEEALARVAGIVEQLEDGQLSLAQSLTAYEEGVKHIKQCHAALDDAERKIELLAGFDAAGNPVLEPFDDTATNSEEHLARRSRDTKSAKIKTKEGEGGDARDLFST